MTTPCTTPTPCPMLIGKTGKCGHRVLYGPDACWRRDVRPERKCGEQDSVNPFAGEGEE